MAENDYYDILELSEEDKKLHGKDFTDKLSKNFRKLSLKWHPDKWVNGTEEEKKTAEEKFKKISEAYSILSDEEKRNQYDNGASFEGFNPFGNGFNPFGGGFGHFGGFGPFGFGFGGQQPSPNAPTQGSDIRTTIEITLEEAYHGTKKKVKINRLEDCDHCHGSGSEDGKRHTCPHCKGTGMISQVTTRGNVQTVISHPCPYCHGTGQSPTTPCHKCNGTGTKSVPEEIEITIPMGIDNGTTIAFSRMGNAGENGGPNGDLLVTFRITAHSKFARQAENLIYTEEVKFTEAMLGYKKDITCIDGSKVNLTVPELTKDGATFTFKGKGMPIMDRFARNIGTGDLVVVIKYIYPNKLNKKQKETLKTFFN